MLSDDVLSNDLATGNIVSNGDGEFRIAGGLQSDQGTYLILEDKESGLAALASEGSLIGNEKWSLIVGPAASGAIQTGQVAELDAMRSEMARLTALSEALIAERSQAQATPVAPDPAPVPTPEPTPEVTPATPAVTDEPVSPVGASDPVAVANEAVQPVQQVYFDPATGLPLAVDPATGQPVPPPTPGPAAVSEN